MLSCKYENLDKLAGVLGRDLDIREGSYQTSLASCICCIVIE
jgi:hypothetical protein